MSDYRRAHSPFEDSAAGRLRRMGLTTADSSPERNAMAVFSAIFAGQFFDDLCDYYNVGVCGHNLGSKYVIGAIKDLKKGDTITYTTIYGTRTYAVTSVKIISNTDWSDLRATVDNRIMLTTCLTNHPENRGVVQAVEVHS